MARQRRSPASASATTSTTTCCNHAESEWLAFNRTVTDWERQPLLRADLNGDASLGRQPAAASGQGRQHVRADGRAAGPGDPPRRRRDRASGCRPSASWPSSCNVSRVTLREAIKALQQAGYVESAAAAPAAPSSIYDPRPAAVRRPQADRPRARRRRGARRPRLPVGRRARAPPSWRRRGRSTRADRDAAARRARRGHRLRARHAPRAPTRACTS